jgi:hypothetical protein
LTWIDAEFFQRVETQGFVGVFGHLRGDFLRQGRCNAPLNQRCRQLRSFFSWIGG